MAQQQLILGAHMSIAGGLHKALLAARKLHCQCVQLFCANQRQWRHTPLTTEALETFRRTRHTSTLSPVVVHSSYLINLAATDVSTHRKSLAALKEELNRCDQLGAEYLVMHVGSHMGRGERNGLDKIIASLNHILARPNLGKCTLLLEGTAGQGSSLGHTFEHLAYIIKKVERSDRLGVCLDTCHMFAAGYDIRTAKAYHRTVREFDGIVGWPRLKVIHLNDSRGKLGSRLDRHEHIGKGLLGIGAFVNFLTDPRMRHLPFILETPKGKSPTGRDLDMLNLARLRRAARSQISRH